MPYTPKTWAEGEKGTAADLNKIELALQVVSTMVSVKEGPYNAKGDGTTNDTTVLNNAITAAGPPGEISAVYFPGGTYFVSAALKVPEEVTLLGLNRRVTVLEAHGEINLLEITGVGAVAIHGLFLKCAAAQTVKGAAIDLSHGFVNNIVISDIQVGSNFFNGFYLVGSVSASGIYIKDVLVEEFTGGVAKYGNAAFVIGHPEHRTFVITMTNITGVAAKQADMPKWVQIRNTDSLTMSTCAFQSGLAGINIGEGDTSTQGTTNLFCDDVWLDGGPEGMGIGWKLNSLFGADFTGCHAQGCNPGVYVQGDVIATWAGGKVYHNFGSGFWFTASMKAKSSFTICGGCVIADNCEAKGAAVNEQCGIYIEKGAGGIVVDPSVVIGNVEHFGGGFQKYGVFTEKGKSRSINIEAGRIFGNLTKNLETQEIEGTAEEKATVKIAAKLEA